MPSPPVIDAGPAATALPGAAGATGGIPGGYRGGDSPDHPAPGPGPSSAQRSAGTVYGGRTGLPTSSNVDAPLHLSGSLTGLVLSRGRPARVAPGERRARLIRVVLALAGLLGLAAVVAIVAATLAGGVIRTLVGGLVHS